MGVQGINCVVTGGTGFVGQRLVEMLVERGAAHVVSFDVRPKPEDALESKKITYVQGDISKASDVNDAVKAAGTTIHCVWHIAALVGPYHQKDAYMAVNYKGTLNVIQACRQFKVGRLVMSSSPSTRFDGNDIEGLGVEDLKIPDKFVQIYAETKAMGEKACRDACCDTLMTVAIAPHQVYGPRDSLFLNNLLHPIGNGKLRIFGSGKNMVSFCHVDNYCHGLILGYDALHKGSPALGRFYIVTDGPPQQFWKVIDQAGVAMGFRSLWTKFHLPIMLLMVLAHICDFLGMLLNRKFKLTPFSVKMLTIHRYFDIEAAKKDLKYEPLIEFDKGWLETIDWFKQNWLPKQKF
uniref:3-beta hydroxysteroid dehydrogenase/isomerase domain-containing protein n=1 Tax=Fibrocapsa japonica TaxID=94617 RepID=A0A7S2UZ88_9STRA|mmetsp:Transcript_20618/g.29837  ORF Transcript_20618/g.29837 Transcript_20618/m.29837 type:complete len:350 (+) Transcript_20618:96-1145(+)|eukprot:CAMPEP_0113936642 /NCGR_PEP_ID=MMETSP1339-20121228/3502_1 /TAXON_ID=94617 /ORGANISM="Fibrocapsa japonica" /LENGTH=349 /DNA_ID=CAMNT_0000939173 /DNA_START=14 /DNA_END=1063 /DNA_ORIENTATION=- /assembly_acc=CAM_ASM_000762